MIVAEMEGHQFFDRLRTDQECIADESPLLAAVHGETCASAYFDVPVYSLLDRAAANVSCCQFHGHPCRFEGLKSRRMNVPMHNVALFGCRMEEMDKFLNQLVRAVETALECRGEAIGVDAISARFELFHAANSICSQKVRAVLAHHGIGYVSHNMNLFTAQTYLPEYVRLRMIGCASFGGALVLRHHGSTSASNGCDGVVVPTLVDREADGVVVDSKRICLLLDRLAPEAKRLRPSNLTLAVDAELAIVDELPNYPLLMGREIGGTPSTVSTRAAFSQRKVAWCDRYLAECADDAPLVEAYKAKRAKELSAVTDLFSEGAMATALAQVHTALDRLEYKLGHRETRWLLDDKPTMADLFWGIQLIRLDDLRIELATFPQIAGYAKATRCLPALRSAVVDWPGAILR